MDKTSRIFFLLITTTFLVIVLSACAGSETSSNENSSGDSDHSDGTDEKITLKYASTSPETHQMHIYGSNIFMEEVERLSEGKVEIEFYPSEQLGTGADMLNLVNSGAADIVLAAPSYIPGKFPLGNVFQLPGALPDAELGSKIIWDIIKDENSIIHKTDYESNGIIPLFGATLPLYQIATTEGKPLESIEDLKGLKLRSAGGVQDLTVENLGGVPVAMETAEQYQSLERGTLDGGIFNLPSLHSNKTVEVLGNLTTNANLSSFVVSVAISEEKFNSLSPEVQDVLIQAGEAAAQNFAENVIKGDEEALQLAIDEGLNTWTLSPEELEKLNEMIQPTWDKWVEDMDKLGFDGQAAIDEMNEALEKYK